MQRRFFPILSGLLLACSFPAWGWYPLTWAALIPLFVVLLSEEPGHLRSPFIPCMLAGILFHLIALYWLLTNVFWAGGWAIVGYAAVCAILGAYWGFFGSAWAFVMRRLPRIPPSLTAAALWAAMEALTNVLFTGFGWTALGYAQGPNTMVLQLAALGGVSLISAIAVAVNVLLAQAIVRPNRRALHAACALALLIGAHLLGWGLLAEPDTQARPFRAALLQSNFSQGMKHDPEYEVEMVRNAAAKSLGLLAWREADLLVWPEALIMPEIDDFGIEPLVQSLVRDTGTPLFTGCARYDKTADGWMNSSCLINADGEIAGHYDKLHLAPFGEYAPLGAYFPFIQRWVPAISDLKPGRDPKVFTVGSRRFGPLICFEVLFGSMADRLRQEGADFLVVITNLGWFGASNALAQEHEIARLRAVETRLPLVHCANTGLTGTFDPWGRFTSVGPAHTRTAGCTAVPAPASQPIPGGPRMFPWLALAASALLLLGAILPGRPSKPTGPGSHDAPNQEAS